MSSEYLPRSQKSYPTLRLSQAHFFSAHLWHFFPHNELKWPHVDAKYLLNFLHFSLFVLKYIRCCSNCSLHAVHFDDQRPEAVSVWPEFLHWTCQQILGICICAKQSTWTRWVPCLPISLQSRTKRAFSLKAIKFSAVLSPLPLCQFFWKGAGPLSLFQNCFFCN